MKKFTIVSLAIVIGLSSWIVYLNRNILNHYEWDVVNIRFKNTNCNFYMDMDCSFYDKKIMLKSGSTLWIKRNKTDSMGSALIFHGANSMGSNQPSGLVLANAVYLAGYDVYALDHVGYGSSPVPENYLDAESWDSAPRVIEAYDYVANGETSRSIVLIGHSMGTLDVVKLLIAGKKANRAYLFGASMPGPGDRNEYWYQRFLKDRKIEKPMPFEDYLKIKKYYYSRNYVNSMLKEHPFITFVMFDKEHENIKASRNEYFNMIKGKKEIYRFPSDHYFNTLLQNDRIFYSQRIVALLAEKFREINH